jgi:hypothetical protein
MEAARRLDSGVGAEVEAALAANAQRRKAALQKQKSQFKNFFAR